MRYLRDTVPQSLLEGKRGLHVAQGNTVAKRERKIVLEAVQKARQFVRCLDQAQEYTVVWSSRKELVQEHGAKAAERIWDEQCFVPARKQPRNFAEPVSQARAVATWRNAGVPWDQCLALWAQAPELDLPDEDMDETSRARIMEHVSNIVQ